MPALRISVGFVVMPLVSGLELRLRMPALSAPSAKILTLRSFNDFPISVPLLIIHFLHCINPLFSQFHAGLNSPPPAGFERGNREPVATLRRSRNQSESSGT